MTTTDQPTSYATRPCWVCGYISVIEITPEQAAALRTGTPVQDVLPDMPAPDREVFISGIHPDCFTEAFGDEDDEPGEYLVPIDPMDDLGCDSCQ